MVRSAASAIMAMALTASTGYEPAAVSPDSITALFEAIYEYDGYMTVFDDEAFPQYLLYDHATQTMSPLTEANMNTNGDWNMSYFQRLARLFRELFALIRAWFESKF